MVGARKVIAVDVDARKLTWAAEFGATDTVDATRTDPVEEIRVLIDLYLRGRYDLDRFVSETIALDGVEEAFARMRRGEVLRSVVTIEAAPP